MNANQKRKGFTLVEVTIVVGALGLLLGGVWMVTSIVWDNYRLQSVQEDVFQTVQNVQRYYGQMDRLRDSAGAAFPNDTDITAEINNDNRRLIPLSLRLDPNDETSDLNHPFASQAGGTFSVWNINGSRFRIVLGKFGQEECIKFLMRFPVLLPELGVRRIKINANNRIFVDPHNIVTPSAEASLPFSLTTATAQCNRAAPNNLVTYDFALRP